VRYVPSFPCFIRSLIRKGGWIWLKTFSASIEIILWSFSLFLLICCIPFNDLHMLNHP
jgi:hypothetical protein